ncbi:hypothetical protein [Sediminibacillus massiliensis]|uniref:hypothetical protein n=1 Tax=Sediminibacillus massiliensis TaxID=1926277 RepID=UPI0009885666|nr:hypothetical protein [Sediminibacillus massiliensis]
MGEAVIHQWQKRLSANGDLLFLYHDKNFCVQLKLRNDLEYWIIFKSGVITVTKEWFVEKSDLSIEVSEGILVQLFEGQGRLTSFPNTLASWNGSYRDCLFFETLLFLA